MSDAMILKNGEVINRILTINGKPISLAFSDVFQNAKGEICNPDGTLLTGNEVANITGSGEITIIENPVTTMPVEKIPKGPSLPPPLTILKDPDENHPNMARRIVGRMVEGFVEQNKPEILGGVWQCTSCNEIKDMDTAVLAVNWRRVDKHYEHNCPGYGCGHFQAVQIYPEGSKPYPEFNEKKHVVGVDFGKKGVTTWVEAEIQEDGTYKILDEGQMPIGREYDLDHIFMHHPTDIHMAEEYQNIRDGARQLAKVILLNTPDCADRSVAIRKIREAVMTANAAIALKGRLFK